MKTTLTRAAGAVALLALPAPGLAQEAMYTAAATMPSAGTLIYQPHITLEVYGARPGTNVRRTTEYTLHQPVQFGLAKDLSLTVDVPVELSREDFTGATGPGGASHTIDVGADEVEAIFKWRFFREDTGGIDTLRAAILAGVVVQTDDRVHADPRIGAVVTKVIGRHGFNLEVGYTLTTGGEREHNLGGEGPSDAFHYNAAYLFRFAPERYAADSTGAWYATIEMNGLYETNGDHEIRWSPGIMYEGREFAFELMAQMPLWADVNERPELDFGVGFGFRFLF
ncbi:MAG: hypothetical protein ACKVS8_01565 [Phycisphaerales bacterium]